MTGQNQAEQSPDTSRSAWLLYRRVVGTTRLAIQAGLPWRLLYRDRVSRLVSELCRMIERWEGVTSTEHRFGGTEFQYEGRELGHIHDWGLVDLPLAQPLAEAVRESSLAYPHHVLPNSGWVSTFCQTDADLARIRLLFEASYIWTKQTSTGEAYASRIESLSAPQQVAQVLADHGNLDGGPESH